MAYAYFTALINHLTMGYKVPYLFKKPKHA